MRRKKKIPVKGEAKSKKEEQGIESLRMIRLDCLGFQEFVSVQLLCVL